MAKSRQFSLLQLAEWTVVIAFVFTALSGCYTKVAWHYTFLKVPLDITALESWVESEMSPTATVRLAEDENRVYAALKPVVLVGIHAETFSNNRRL